jgi:tetratricopeptide (TPR) repeat protein
VIVFTGIALAAGSVSAQEIHPDCPDVETDEEAQDQAGKWFGKGEKLVNKGKYDKALGAFLCAYALAPHPAPVFNAAQAARSGGKNEVALTYFRQYLSMAPDGPLAEQARKEVAELEEVLGGQPVEPMPAAPVSTAPVEPTPAVTSDTELPWEVPEPEVVEEDEGPNPLAVTGWVFFSVGLAGVAAGGVLQGLAGKAETDGEATSDYAYFEEQVDKVDGFQKGALAGFIAGGALIATGLVLVVASGKGDEEEATVSVSPAPGGLSMGGTF